MPSIIPCSVDTILIPYPISDYLLTRITYFPPVELKKCKKAQYYLALRENDPPNYH